MRIIVISDTHIPACFDQIPEEFLKKAKGADLIIHAGDIVEFEVLKQLEKLAPVKAVWGNMDPPETRKYLKEKEILDIEGIKIGIMHGAGSPMKLLESLTAKFAEDKPDIIIFGHSHEAFSRKIGTTLFLNPGSLTENFQSGFRSYLEILINKGKYETKLYKF